MICKKLILNGIAAAIALTVLTGCGMSVPPRASVDAPMTLKNAEEYYLADGDKIKLTVYGEDTLTGEYVVDRRGVITVPLVGEVGAAGLTKDELQDSIEKTLTKGKFLAQPHVTVDVLTMRPFFILGEVKNPGSYDWQPSLDVFKAVAMAGGYTPRAAKGEVLIDRGEGTRRQHMNGREGTPILPGDSITVRERIF